MDADALPVGRVSFEASEWIRGVEGTTSARLAVRQFTSQLRIFRPRLNSSHTSGHGGGPCRFELIDLLFPNDLHVFFPTVYSRNFATTYERRYHAPSQALAAPAPAAFRSASSRGRSGAGTLLPIIFFASQILPDSDTIATHLSIY